MKSKSLFAAFLVGFIVQSVSCSAQNLNISVENNSKDFNVPQVFYWVNNNTGKEIKNIEWSLNGVYFYTADLPIDGDRLELFDFAKKDGSRYDYYSVKPIELKAKCSKGRYSVKFDDIPYEFEVADYYKTPGDVYSWTEEFTVENKTADGVAVSLSVSFGYKPDDTTTPSEIASYDFIIKDYLKVFIAQKNAADFSPVNEAVKTEVKDYLNDMILRTGRIREVRFKDIQ